MTRKRGKSIFVSRRKSMEMVATNSDSNLDSNIFKTDRPIWLEVIRNPTACTRASKKYTHYKLEGICGPVSER